ncbi:MAG TPA: hypothetical protein VFQ61_16810 [Polyangiaceae bacterium]|nr:hypothetical protein [Polyangiaceae bacterium]
MGVVTGRSGGRGAVSSELRSQPRANVLRSKPLAKLLGGLAIVSALAGAYWLGAQRSKYSDPAETSAKGALPDARTAPPIILTVSPAQPVARDDARVAPAAVEPAPAELPSGSGDPRPQLSPLEHRDRVLTALRASGRDTRLTSFGQTVVKGWASKLQQLAVGGKVDPLECYAKGCAVTIEYPSQSAAEDGNEVVTRSGEFNGWQAGKMRSGYITKSNGAVEVTWILDSPPADSPVLPDKLPADNFDELKEMLARSPK